MREFYNGVGKEYKVLGNLIQPLEFCLIFSKGYEWTCHLIVLDRSLAVETVRSLLGKKAVSVRTRSIWSRTMPPFLRNITVLPDQYPLRHIVNDAVLLDRTVEGV